MNDHLNWIFCLTRHQVVDAIKDLVQDCNFDCNDSGIALQAMDNSHVALVSMLLRSEAFTPFRCDRNIALGINLGSLTKVLRAAQNDDILTIKAEDAPDVVNLVFENNTTDRMSEYDIKLMDIDQEHLGIPETEYAATISMPAAEFQRICRDLSALSESGTFCFSEHYNLLHVLELDCGHPSRFQSWQTLSHTDVALGAPTYDSPQHLLEYKEKDYSRMTLASSIRQY